MIDVKELQKEIDELYKTVMTNQNAFGVQSYGGEAKHGGINIIEINPIAQMNDSWFDGLEDLDLIDEFELMLDLEKEVISKTKDCSHQWIEVGKSPYSGHPWINCKHCDMSKEDYDWEKEHSPPPVTNKLTEGFKSDVFWGI